MSLPNFASFRTFQSVVSGHTRLVNQLAWYQSTRTTRSRRYIASQASSTKQTSSEKPDTNATEPSQASTDTSSESSSLKSSSDSSKSSFNVEDQPFKPSWEDKEWGDVESFAGLPSKTFGRNQHIETNEEFKRALRNILRSFPAISHGFAYGSGVFPQSSSKTSRSDLSPHPQPPKAILEWQKGGGKVIDFIFATKFAEHFHSLNLKRHRNHYSLLGSFGSAAVSFVQEKFGAGAYFNPYITVNGTMIKYGVVTLKTLYDDLNNWDTLYFAGRLQKPVKILTEDPNIRIANQRNLMAAVRCSLLMLPEKFTEEQLYHTIASLSYTGDMRMSVNSENPDKIANIVQNQMAAFRQLYNPLVNELPNVHYADSRLKTTNPDWQSLPESGDVKMAQNMDPNFRANMVRRLPKSFRERVYFLYQRKFSIPGREFKEMLASSKDEDAKGGVRKPVGSAFDKRIAEQDDIADKVRQAVVQTVKWPSTVQTLKGLLTGGLTRSWQYVKEKRLKGAQKSK